MPFAVQCKVNHNLWIINRYIIKSVQCIDQNFLVILVFSVIDTYYCEGLLQSYGDTWMHLVSTLGFPLLLGSTWSHQVAAQALLRMEGTGSVFNLHCALCFLKFIHSPILNNLFSASHTKLLVNTKKEGEISGIMKKDLLRPNDWIWLDRCR